MTKFKMEQFYPKAWWAKFLAKVPLILWRLGLGKISGQMFMIITTRGRKSGLPRRTMVECHWINGIKYAPSGFGAKAQWYQNIMADPRVTVQTADGTESMWATRVTDDTELGQIYDGFKRDNATVFHLYLQGSGIEASPQSLIANKERVFFLRFEPTDEDTPPGLPVDLLWIWPVLLIGFVVDMWLIRSRIIRNP